MGASPAIFTIPSGVSTRKKGEPRMSDERRAEQTIKIREQAVHAVQALVGGSLDARRGSLAEQAADSVLAVVMARTLAGDAATGGLDLRSSGLLWLINATTFHPRGFALAVDERGRLSLLGDGSEAWVFPDEDSQAPFCRAEATLAAHRRDLVAHTNT